MIVVAYGIRQYSFERFECRNGRGTLHVAFDLNHIQEARNWDQANPSNFGSLEDSPGEF